MKFLFTITLFLFGCSAFAANDISNFGTKIENSYDINSKIIKNNHVVITIIKTQTCITTVELPKKTTFAHLTKLVNLQKKNCVSNKKPKKVLKKKNPKLNINL